MHDFEFKAGELCCENVKVSSIAKGRWVLLFIFIAIRHSRIIL